MVKTRINWRVVWAVMRVHDWNWATLSRKMGVTESHLSEVRRGKKGITLGFCELLAHTIQIDYGRLLIHPTANKEPSAKEFLRMSDEERNPWPHQMKDNPTPHMMHESERIKNALNPKKHLTDEDLGV